MTSVIKNVFKDLYSHKYTYIFRGIILQLGVTTFGSLLLSLLFRVVLISSDLPGVTTDNVLSFLTNPLTVVLLFVYLFALAFLVYFEFSLLVEMIRHKESRLTLTIRRLKQDTIEFFQALSKWHIFAFLGYLILTIPFLQFIFSSALLQNLYIPKFLSSELLKTANGKLIYGSIYGLLGYLNLRLIYTLPLTVTNHGQDFGKNMAQSWRLTKGKKIFQLLGLVFVIACLTGLIVLLSLLGIGMAELLDSEYNNLLIEILFLCFAQGVLFISNLLIKIASLSCLLRFLGRHIAEQAPMPPKVRRKKGTIRLAFLLIVIGGASYFYNSNRISAETTGEIQVIAHRGLVSQAVENSLEGLEAAAQYKVNYVELDIILSKDGQFIVSHDDNLKRLTGKNINISESNASDVIGLKTSQNGHSSQIVSFDAYVEKAKELGVKLLVELKPTGSEPDNYQQLFVDKMKELGVSDSYKVMSLDLDTIEKVEKLDPTLNTGYCISLQIGDFTTQAVDFYAIEDFSYSEKLATSAHNNGKGIYVWTINSADDMESYLQTSIDGLITDYPDVVKDVAADLKTDNSYLAYFLRLIN